MQPRLGAKLRNNLRYAAAFAVILGAAWLIGLLLDTWLRGYEVGLAGGLVVAVVIFCLLINGQHDTGLLGVWCRAIARPFRQEPE